MEFITGQAFSVSKVSEYIKKSKEKKACEEQTKETLRLIFSAKEEIDLLKSSLNLATDKEMLESSIYRLKAAELDFNRQLKTAKALQNSNQN